MNEKDFIKVKKQMQIALQEEVKNKLIVIRGRKVLLDVDVAALYGVETKRVNEAVRRNAEKFPDGYLYRIADKELTNLRSQIATSSWGGTRKPPMAFTEKGLYMLATILKSPNATAATFAIIETFAAVRDLQSELIDLHQEGDKEKQQSMIKRFGDILSEVVMPELETSETESSLEINFFIGKLKHTVKRIKKAEED